MCNVVIIYNQQVEGVSIIYCHRLPHVGRSQTFLSSWLLASWKVSAVAA